MKNKALIWSLAGISAVLMSLPFLVPHCGFIALFAIVPLLCADRIARLTGMKRFFLVHYSCFVVFNALTTFWVCNATIGGGIFAVVANALQMSVIFALYRLSRKRFDGILPYVFLMVMWIAWERAYYSAQISWPWLVLGNSFARSIRCIQWYEYTGVLGGSLWVWLTNLGIFGLMVALSDGSFYRWNLKARIAAPAGLLAILAAPFIWSAVIWNRYTETDDKLEVFIAQPNIDPYHKFEKLSQEEQTDILIGQIETGLSDRRDADSTAVKPLLVLAPETFTGDVFHVDGEIRSNTLRRLDDMLQHYPDVSLMFGASTYDYIRSALPPSKTARKIDDRLYVESHNSALMTDRRGGLGIYHKSRLVVAVEMTPYPALFCKIDDLLGHVMGRCVGQKEPSTLNMKPEEGGEIRIAPVICYESIYGEYCTGYVQKGAQALAIITNDAWWKDTPGYRQHLSYASLRAIETRRDIARCANTGTSAFIDQRGQILEKSHWWKKETMRGTVNLSDRKTFFVEHGDITGRVCTFVFLLLLAALAVRLIIRSKK